MTKRYLTMHFPACYGEMLETNSFLWAWLIAAWRVFRGSAEGRIIDSRTRRHTVL